VTTLRGSLLKDIIIIDTSAPSLTIQNPGDGGAVETGATEILLGDETIRLSTPFGVEMREGAVNATLRVFNGDPNGVVFGSAAHVGLDVSGHLYVKAGTGTSGWRRVPTYASSPPSCCPIQRAATLEEVAIKLNDVIAALEAADVLR
jgi:hypothetical protein